MPMKYIVFAVLALSANGIGLHAAFASCENALANHFLANTDEFPMQLQFEDGVFIPIGKNKVGSLNAPFISESVEVKQ